MFPGEMVILMAIALAGDSVSKILDRPMDISSEYISYLYGSLVRRGYLKENASGRYRLTSKGEKTLTQFLHENQVKVKDLLKTLQRLSIETSSEVEVMAREKVGVR